MTRSIREIIRAAGGHEAIAAKTGLNPRSVLQWADRGSIPWWWWSRLIGLDGITADELTAANAAALEKRDHEKLRKE